MRDQGNNHTPRVLLIEDDLSVRRMLRFSLRDAGFDISEAATGAAALEELQQQVPEAIILDLGLPDGLAGAVLDWIKRSQARSDGGPAWVVISAMDQQDVVHQYGPLGKHFFAKPFDPWQLITQLQKLLATRESQSPTD